MKSALRKLVIVVVLFIGTIVSLTAVMTSTPVQAAGVETCTCEDGTEGKKVSTAILSSGCECGNGEGVKSILNLVVRVMTVGIGVVGVAGITFFGIQYLTSGGNEEQTRKAKRRLFEIVIGFAAYALIYAVLTWLLPEFQPFGG